MKGPTPSKCRLAGWFRRDLSIKPMVSCTNIDPKRVLATVCCLALQFNPRQKPFVAFGNVPIADSQPIEIPARYLPLKPK
jgi:hypothetical protein